MFSRSVPQLVGSTIVCSAIAASSTHAETTTLSFTDPGTTYTGFIFPGDPRIGGHVYNARVYLDVEIFDGSDAAEFDTDLTLPLIPDEGATPIVTFNGADLGWSGTGVFHHYLETNAYNGTFIQTLFGAASAPLDGVLLKSARLELDYTPVPEPLGLSAVAALGMMVRRRRTH